MSKRDRNAGNETLPLVTLVYGIVGLACLQHRLTQIRRDAIYDGLAVVAGQFPRHFNGVHFTRRGRIQHSKAIEDTLSRLAGTLECIGPSGRYMGFLPGHVVQVRRRLKRWVPDGETRREIEVMSRAFYRVVQELRT